MPGTHLRKASARPPDVAFGGAWAIAYHKQEQEQERTSELQAVPPFRWEPAEAARALGISRATLYRRVHEHRIEMPRMKL
ncbi:hypothetical protein B7H17_15755 [Pseudomonas putida]|uniref:DNA binding HTH domain-containing protein n=1 Tax=Pseudomonas putida TaxID=303 RepID=A0A1X0ZUI3_PSEPU|nr:hypothetical protein B7H17_15755 [Pseudomonas putida]